MARPRTLRTLVSRIDDAQLKALWDLRCTCSGNADYLLVTKAIKERVRLLRAVRGMAKMVRNR